MSRIMTKGKARAKVAPAELRGPKFFKRRFKAPGIGKENKPFESKKVEISESVSTIPDQLSTAEFAEIDSVRFTIFTLSDIAAENLTEVTRKHDLKDPSNIAGTVYDQHFGYSSYNNSECSTCNNPRDKCPGHYGYISLPFFIIHPPAGKLIAAILNIVCFNCGKPVMGLEQLKSAKISGRSIIERASMMEELALIGKGKSKIRCVSGVCPVDGNAVYKADENRIKANGEGDPISNSIIYDILRSLTIPTQKEKGEIRESTELSYLLGFDSVKYQPTDLLFRFVMVLPPTMRESVSIASNKTFDHFGKEYEYILSKANLYGTSGSAADRNKAETNINAKILSLFGIGGAKGGLPSGKDKHNYGSDLKGKKGYPRGNLMGKRIDNSCRAVVGGDTYLPFGLVGVPRKIANNMYEYLYITEYNKDEIKNMLTARQLVHYYDRTRSYDVVKRRIIYSDQMKIKLRVGDIVTRRLKDFDMMNIGRNPTIHKIGMMGTYIRVIDGDTFKINNAYTTPFNADYDGDEIHGEKLQDLGARTELRYISNVFANIISSESMTASMGLVLDYISNWYKATNTKDFGIITITPEKYEYYASLALRKSFNTYKLDERLQYYGVNKYSTRGIFSSLLPYDFNYDSSDKSVSIRSGILIKGVLTKQALGPSGEQPGSLFKMLELQYIDEPYLAGEILSNLSRVGAEIGNITTGIDDLHIDNEEIKQVRNSEVSGLQAIVSRISADVNDTDVENQRLENEIIALTDRVRERSTNATIAVLAKTNPFRIMANSGAKGSSFNFMQMITMLGQQFISGDRLPANLSDGNRVLPYAPFVAKEKIEDRGLCVHSFNEGLDSGEFMRHQMATRENLSDTSTKTADIGDLHHKINKALENMKVEYDQTLRDGRGVIIQFIANDGIEPSRGVYTKYQGKSVPFFVDVWTIVEQINSKILFAGDGNQ